MWQAPMACTIVLFEPLIAGLETALARFPVRVLRHAPPAAVGSFVHVIGGHSAVEYAQHHAVHSLVVTDGSSAGDLSVPSLRVPHEDTVAAIDECLRFWSAYVSTKAHKKALVRHLAFRFHKIVALTDCRRRCSISAVCCCSATRTLWWTVYSLIGHQTSARTGLQK